MSSNGGASFEIWSLELKACQLQPNGMPCVKTGRGTINRLPAGRPFPSITIERRRVESQPGNDGERVTLTRIDGDPFARTPLAVTAKLGGTHGRGDQTSRAQNIGNCAGTIVGVILERFVTAAIAIPLVAKLVPGPDRAFYRKRSILRRGRFSESKTREVTRHNRSGRRKEIGNCRWNDQYQNRDNR